ncbi:hypothetical protein [Algoriphagus namhaensis]
MKNFVLVLGLMLFLTVSSVFSQESEVQLIQTQNISLQPQIQNSASIDQIGNRNNAEAKQELIGVGQNVLMISQSGTAHQAFVSQSGADLNTQLMQISASNSAEVFLIGNNISLTATQNGRQNSLNTTLESYSNRAMTANFLQEGNRNEIDFAVRNSVGFDPGVDQSLSIVQMGNNQSFSAQYQDLGAPAVNVTQNPGFGGAGMTVRLTTLPGYSVR